MDYILTFVLFRKHECSNKKNLKERLETLETAQYDEYLMDTEEEEFRCVGSGKLEEKRKLMQIIQQRRTHIHCVTMPLRTF